MEKFKYKGRLITAASKDEALRMIASAAAKVQAAKGMARSKVTFDGVEIPLVYNGKDEELGLLNMLSEKDKKEIAESFKSEGGELYFGQDYDGREDIREVSLVIPSVDNPAISYDYKVNVRKTVGPRKPRQARSVKENEIPYKLMQYYIPEEKKWEPVLVEINGNDEGYYYDGIACADGTGRNFCYDEFRWDFINKRCKDGTDKCDPETVRLMEEMYLKNWDSENKPRKVSRLGNHIPKGKRYIGSSARQARSAYKGNTAADFAGFEVTTVTDATESGYFDDEEDSYGAALDCFSDGSNSSYAQVGSHTYAIAPVREHRIILVADWDGCPEPEKAVALVEKWLGGKLTGNSDEGDHVAIFDGMHAYFDVYSEEEKATACTSRTHVARAGTKSTGFSTGSRKFRYGKFVRAKSRAEIVNFCKMKAGEGAKVVEITDDEGFNKLRGLGDVLTGWGRLAYAMDINGNKIAGLWVDSETNTYYYCVNMGLLLKWT